MTIIKCDYCDAIATIRPGYETIVGTAIPGWVEFKIHHPTEPIKTGHICPDCFGRLKKIEPIKEERE